MVPAITIKTKNISNNDTSEEKNEDGEATKPSPVKSPADAEATDEKKVFSEEKVKPESDSGTNEVKSIEEAKPKLEEGTYIHLSLKQNPCIYTKTCMYIQ